MEQKYSSVPYKNLSQTSSALKLKQLFTVTFSEYEQYWYIWDVFDVEGQQFGNVSDCLYSVLKRNCTKCY